MVFAEAAQGVDWHSWFNTGLAVLIGAASIAYVRIIKGRAETRVTEAKAKADEKITDRDQIMKEYGLLLGGLRTELDRQQDNQKTMWDFQMQRAKLEYRKLEKGGVAIADTLVEARESLEPIREKLKAVYSSFATLAQPERDRSTMLAIVGSFDQFIVDHVCEPYGLTHGECLYIALSVAKNGETK